MARIVRVKNNSGTDDTWVGQLIFDGEYYTLSTNEYDIWSNNTKVFNDIGSGNLIVNKGEDTTDDISNSVEAWNWITGDTLPRSNLDLTKIAVHASPKPITEKSTYAVWSGAGDDMSGSPIDHENNLGAGPLLSFSLSPGTSHQCVDMEFDPVHGRVWVHEGYAKFEGASHGDYFDAYIMAYASFFQPYVNLIGYLEDNWFIPAVPGGSPDMAQLGFATTPVLIPRTYVMDGDWDYDEDTGTLSPNFTKTGEYKISDVVRPVHKYVNKVPATGSAYPYTTMSSDETAELNEGYFIRITAHNVSDTSWTASVFIEMYRERTTTNVQLPY